MDGDAGDEIKMALTEFERERLAEEARRGEAVFAKRQLFNLLTRAREAGLKYGEMADALNQGGPPEQVMEGGVLVPGGLYGSQFVAALLRHAYTGDAVDRVFPDTEETDD